MRKFFFLFIFVISFSHLLAQQEDSLVQQKTKVDFIRADQWEHKEKDIPGAQLFTGNVVFRHDSAYLYCDTVFFYKEKNALEAFSNVRMIQGDTLFVYGDQLYYEGNTKMARLRNNVRMENGNMVLLTDSFNYDRKLNLAYFFDRGVILDEENELTSLYGKYNPETKLATFQYEVNLTNPKMNLFSDTLIYNTNTKIADIIGPSRILSDSTTILTSRGWYDTQNENSMLLDNSSIHNKGTEIIGDSIFYDRLTGLAEIFGNMYVNDSIQKSILKGDYGYYNELIEYALVTDSALCIDYSTADTLYMHADTLKAYTVWGNNKIPDKREKTSQVQRDSIEASRDSVFNLEDYSLLKNDSVLNLDSSAVISITDSSSLDLSFADIKKDTVVLDTIYKRMDGYYGVRIFSTRLQAVCDSMTMSSKDTIINMYSDPIIWSDNYQLFGDFIQIYMNDSTLEKAHVQGYSFSAERKDSIHFDQIYGKELLAYFDEKGELYQVDVNGNVNLIYYPIDSKDSSLNEQIDCETSFLILKLKNRKMESIKLFPENVGVMKPIEILGIKDLYLERYAWYDYIRPLHKMDIYQKRIKKTVDTLKKRRK